MLYKKIYRLDNILIKDNIFGRLDTINHKIYRQIICIPFVCFNYIFYQFYLCLKAIYTFKVIKFLIQTHIQVIEIVINYFLNNSTLIQLSSYEIILFIPKKYITIFIIVHLVRKLVFFISYQKINFMPYMIFEYYGFNFFLVRKNF